MIEIRITQSNPATVTTLFLTIQGIVTYPAQIMMILNDFLNQLNQIANPTNFPLEHFSSMPKRINIPWPAALPPLSRKEINLLAITFPIPFWSVFLFGFILYKWVQMLMNNKMA
jgi:hypothetical protein